MKKRIITFLLISITTLSFTVCNCGIGKIKGQVYAQTFITYSSVARGIKTLSGMNGLPDKFQENAFEHIKKLCSFGVRSIGSPAEKSTIDYISKSFKNIGIETKTEGFKFQYFDADSVTVTINGSIINCEQIWVNPYKDNKISGKGILYNPDSSNIDLKDQIVLIKNTVNAIPLLELNTKAVLVLSEADFEKLAENQDLSIDISIAGKKLDLASSNVIGSIYPVQKTNKEIIISAHWDSINGPGASDNASGIGVMLELAKYYSSMKKTLPCIIRFVALGGEELGLLGSKAYVLKHSNELKSCKLLFNIDTVGGNGDIYIEMPRNIEMSQALKPSKPLDPKIVSMMDYKMKWLLNMPFPAYLNVPEWLKDNINKSCNELKYKFLPGNVMGSDHLIFAQSGTPSTNIAIAGGAKENSDDDTIDKISIISLRKAGEIVASVVNKTMNTGR